MVDHTKELIMRIHFFLSKLHIADVAVSQDNYAYQYMLKLADRYYREFRNQKISIIPGVQETRQLFHQIKLDPTKHRPSSEALLRRALKQKKYPKINTMVDIGNWCSLEFLIPICVYNTDKIAGKINFRMGKKNESYLAHNNREINLENRLVVADELGAFGSPITDSIRTAVTIDTKNVLVLLFSPKTFSHELLEDQLKTIEERIFKFCGGNTISKEIKEISL